ncbi:glycosyltransferase family 2 protein [Falsibacillus albus]|uniref:Glycosyltransferase family 2 protein n=1 Tax=Falsibacillus albus TaxID=2478915 RepID=A0A3L7K2R7_9BACI|nr:glycosyltransferase family A protein [Falsibacillus albus]RLQ96281.1 glycosyltransferase family 2 protein [Falsibacillus albus]
MSPVLTVFTPTYDRAHTLHLCYESLLKQSCKEFIWLIIDDGSTDGTKMLVEAWMKEGKIPISYHYQENQGMHGAHNTAYRLIETELNVCIDSDDYVAEDAIDKIIRFWRENGNENYAGIVGLDADFQGGIIGTRIPKGLKTTTLLDLYRKHKVSGDKKLVYRSALTKNTPEYPMFAGEKYCPLAYKYILIDQIQPLLVFNEVLCHVEYQQDGSSLNMIKQYKNNPKGFSFYRIISMKYACSFKERFRASIHYVSSNLMIRNIGFIKDSPNRITTLVSIPFGVALYLYISYTKRATVMKTP